MTNIIYNRYSCTQYTEYITKWTEQKIYRWEWRNHQSEQIWCNIIRHISLRKNQIDHAWNTISDKAERIWLLLVCNMNGIRYLLFDYEAYITSAVERKYRATIRMLKPMATFMLRNCVDAGNASKYTRHRCVFHRQRAIELWRVHKKGIDVIVASRSIKLCQLQQDLYIRKIDEGNRTGNIFGDSTQNTRIHK